MKAMEYLITIFLFISFVPAIEGTGRCNAEEYWESLFGRCMPCSGICKPLNRSDCTRKCPDFFRSLTACSTEQYWESLYGACINCTIICNPPSRDKCKEKCSESLQLLTTDTLTVPAPTTDATQTTKRRITDYVSVIVSAALTMTIVVMFVLYCYRSKIAQCARKHFTCRDDKKPIEETGSQSDDPFVEQRQQPV